MSPSTSDGNYSANKSIQVNASNGEMESPPPWIITPKVFLGNVFVIGLN